MNRRPDSCARVHPPGPSSPSGAFGRDVRAERDLAGGTESCGRRLLVAAFCSGFGWRFPAEAVGWGGAFPGRSRYGTVSREGRCGDPISERGVPGNLSVHLEKIGFPVIFVGMRGPSGDADPGD